MRRDALYWKGMIGKKWSLGVVLLGLSWWLGMGVLDPVPAAAQGPCQMISAGKEVTGTCQTQQGLDLTTACNSQRETAMSGTDVSGNCTTGQTCLACVGIYENLESDAPVLRDSADEVSVPFELCKRLRSEDKTRCEACVGTDEKNEKMWTAIGCLPTRASELVPALINFVLGIGGLIMVVQIIIAAANIIFANGDSGKIQKAQTSIMNSVIALLFIIFGVTILQIIGQDVLRLPGYFGN